MLEDEIEFHNKRAGNEAEGKGRLTSVYASMSNALKIPRDMLTDKIGNVLEIGSYLGDNSEGIDPNTNYTGIDISDAAVDHANKVFAKKNVNFYCMDAHKVESLNSYYDYVYGNGILHHLDLDVFIPALSNVLKPNSKAVFLEPNIGPPWLRLFRWLTPWLRSEDEHPLVKSDYDFFQEYFEVEILNFGLLCPFIPMIFMNNHSVIKWCQKLDSTLSKTMFGKWSWMSVVILTSREPNQK